MSTKFGHSAMDGDLVCQEYRPFTEGIESSGGYTQMTVNDDM